MPTISDYNSIPLSDGIKEHFCKGIPSLLDREIPCSDTPRAHLDKMFVSVNGKTYSIQELCTMAEAFQYLLKAPSKLDFFANTAYVNYLHHNPCNPDPELTESTLKGLSQIHNIERGTPGYILLYIMQEYFSGVIESKQKTVAPKDTLDASEKMAQQNRAINTMAAALADVPDGSNVFKLTLAEAYLVFATLKNEPTP